MTILKIEVDTKELGIDKDGYSYSFEDAFHREMKKKITKQVIGDITKEEVAQYSMLVQERVDEGVNNLFKNLLSEDVVITDGYGSKQFVGCVEDYIKKSIDEKYLYPVDYEGKKVNGCTSSTKTWIQWYLEKSTKKLLDNQINEAEKRIKRNIESTIKDSLSEFIENTVNNTITSKLKNVGIMLK